MLLKKSTRRISLCLAISGCLCLPVGLLAQGPSSAASGQTAAAPKLPPELQKIADQYTKAVKLHADKKAVEAIAAYKEYIRLAKAANLDPQAQLPAYQNMVLLYQYLIGLGQEVKPNTDALEAALRESAHLDPNNANVQVQLALITSQEQKTEEARHFANRALQLKPDNSAAGTAHFVLGNLAAIKKDYPTASKEFGAATKLLPKNPLAFFNYGLSLAEEKKYPEALAAFEQARKLDPKLNRVDAYIAAVKQQMNHGDDAMAEYDRILKADPRNAHALLNRAYLLERKGQTSLAISAYLDALAVVPNDYDAQAGVARLYAVIRNPAAAAQHYQLAHQIAAGKDAARDAQALAGLASSEQQESRSLVDSGQRSALIRSAEQHLKQAVALVPKDLNMLIQLGGLYELTGRYTDAADLYRKQLMLTPVDSLLTRHLANVYVMQVDLAGFIKTWESYQQKAPDDPTSYREIANVHEKVSAWAPAVDEWKLLIARKPTTSILGDALANMANDLAQLKKYEEARTQYRLVLALDDKAPGIPASSQPAEIAGIQSEQLRALHGLADIALMENKTDEALQWMEQVRARQTEIYHKANQPVPGQIYRDIAQVYEHSAKPDLAIKTYLEMAQALPNDPLPYQEMGRLYEAQNQVDLAVAAFRKAADMPNNPKAPADRLRIAETYQRHMLFDKAITEYEKLNALTPNNKEILTQLAQAYRQVGQDAKALPIYDALQKADPTLRWIDDARAIVLTRLKRYDEARALYLRQIERNPEVRQNYANLAYVWAQEGKLDGFLDWIKPRLEKTPANLTLMSVVLDEYIRQKKEPEGWAYLQKLTDQNQMQRPVLEAYAALLQQHQKKAESLAVFRRIAAQYPKDVVAQTALADQLDFNDLKEEANGIYIALLARTDLPDATQRSLRRQLGGRYARQEKWPDAIAQFRELVRRSERDFDALMTLGRMLEQGGQKADAIAIYEKALTEKEFPPIVYMDAHNHLGKLYEDQNNRAEAIRHYQEALKFDPENTIAIQGLKRLGVKQG